MFCKFTEPECLKSRTFSSSKVESILERWEGKQGMTEKWKRFSGQKGESTRLLKGNKGVEIKSREEKAADTQIREAVAMSLQGCSVTFRNTDKYRT